MSACRALATTIGAANRSPVARRAVSWSIVCSAVSASICLGISGVDIGHRRVPDPPDRMTGMMGLESGIRILLCDTSWRNVSTL